MVKLDEPGVGLDFLGYTFRYDRDRHGREGHYLNLIPSEKSLQRVRDKLREMTDASKCFTPIRRADRTDQSDAAGLAGVLLAGLSPGRRTGTWTATRCGGCETICTGAVSADTRNRKA